MRDSTARLIRRFLGTAVIFGLLHAHWSRAAGPGKPLFERRCGGCHAVDRDKEGPRLRGVLGRAAGSLTSFEYSEALRRSGIVWSAQALERWLSDPEEMVPGTEMQFRVETAAEREAIIDYLKQLTTR